MDTSRKETATLVIGGTGKTGRRVAEQLAALGRPVRIGSRTSDPVFDWDDESTWGRSLDGVGAVYLTYPTDLGLPGAADRIRVFSAAAIERGARRLVLLSGRGQDAHASAERAIRESGADWAIVRSAWLAQNFSEGFLTPMVLDGSLTLPAGDAVEPFVDAAVVVAALTDRSHAGRVYTVSGPESLSFAAAAETLSTVAGRLVRYVPIGAEELAANMTGEGLPPELIEVLGEVFAEFRDGRSSLVADGVERALGRTPSTFASYAEATAAAGAWTS